MPKFDLIFDDILRHVPTPLRPDAATILIDLYAAMTGHHLTPPDTAAAVRVAVDHAKGI